MGMKRLTLGLTLVSLLLAPATAVGFPLPEPADTTIKPPTSLAGIVLGESFDDAEAAWGSQGHCVFDVRDSLCVYGEPLSKTGSAQFFCKDGDTVSDVSISVGLVHGKYVYKGPLLDLKTTRGSVGLGDKLSKLQHAYPKLRKKSAHEYVIAGGGSTMTVFVSSKKDGLRITLFKITPG